MKYTYKNGDIVTWNRKVFYRCPFEKGRVTKITEIRNDKFIGLEGLRCWWYWYELQPTQQESLYKRIKYWTMFWCWYWNRYYRERKVQLKH